VSPAGDIYVSTSNRDWNPGTGFPKQRDDRILKISPIKAGTAKIPAAKETVSVKPKSTASRGNVLYDQYCSSCHKADGKGIKGTFPPLEKSATVNSNKKSLINIVLHGRSGNVVINGLTYDQPMPAFKFLSDQQVADILTYVRTGLGNRGTEITAAEIAKERK
jgi:mono/diheme cytochrome c family protein